MKKADLKKFLIIMGIFVLLFMPYLVNAILIAVQVYAHAQIISVLDLDLWYDILAIGFPCTLTYLVICQSEQQQKENAHLTQKMLNTELKSKIGYFVPEVDKKDIHGKWIPHRHSLKEGIGLIHAGDDIIFIIEASYAFHGRRIYVPQNEPVCFLNKTSFNRYCLECNFTDEDLNLPQIDLDIELVMKNSKGYQYSQIINLGFDNDHGIGIINRFNMNIQEVSADAD